MYTYYHNDYPLHPEIAYGNDLHISLIASVVPVATSLKEGTIVSMYKIVHIICTKLYPYLRREMAKSELPLEHQNRIVKMQVCYNYPMYTLIVDFHRAIRQFRQTNENSMIV